MSKSVGRVVYNAECISPAVSSLVQAIIQSVDTEFGTKAELFTPVVVRMDMRQGDEFEATKSPGVYVFIHEEYECLKVGKNHLNASKRALEHCRDNTSSQDGSIQMAEHINSDKTYMLVFALQEPESLHWVLALEHYLEKTLHPKILSVRNG